MKRAIILVAGLATATAAQAEILTFNAVLLGINERPNQVSTPATGFGSLVIDTVTLNYSGELRWKDLTAAATDSHIHAGGKEDFGNVLYGIGATGTTTDAAGFTGKTFSGTLTTKNITLNGVPQGSFTPEQQIDQFFRQGRTYFNVHTSNFPGGEIRGQLVPVPEPASLAALGLGAVALLRRRRKQA